MGGAHGSKGSGKKVGKPKDGSTLFSALPPDVLDVIYSSIPKQDLFGLAYVSRNFKAISEASNVWGKLCTDAWGQNFLTKNTFTNSELRTFLVKYNKGSLLYIPPCFSSDVLALSTFVKKSQLFRCPVLGASGVGKTSFTRRIHAKVSLDAEYDPTIEEELEQEVIAGKQIQFQLVDFFFGCEYCPSEAERDRAMYQNPDHDLYVVIYSVVSRRSFDAVYPIIKQLRTTKMSGPPILIVGNKTDLRGKYDNDDVPTTEALEFAHKNHCAFTEVSLRECPQSALDPLRDTIFTMALEFSNCPKTKENLQKMIKKDPVTIDIAQYIAALKKCGYGD